MASRGMTTLTCEIALSTLCSWKRAELWNSLPLVGLSPSNCLLNGYERD